MKALAPRAQQRQPPSLPRGRILRVHLHSRDLDADFFVFALQPDLSADMKRTGVDLLRDPMKNKGLAFTKAERAALGIRGLLPSRVLDMAGAESHALAQLRSKTSPLEKYIYLQSLQDRDETMYFYLVTRHIREIMPLIYTPTVGDGCIRFGHIFRRARGLFVSLEDRGCVAELVAN